MPSHLGRPLDFYGLAYWLTMDTCPNFGQCSLEHLSRHPASTDLESLIPLKEVPKILSACPLLPTPCSHSACGLGWDDGTIGNGSCNLKARHYSSGILG